MGLGENNPCRVFLSHTSEFRNFPRGRSYLAAVESAVSAAGHVIVDMREFAASDAAPAQVCQEKVRGCEVYLGIFGTRYGSPVRDRPEVSYTELEFETASDPAHPLERLVFLLDQEAENPGIPAKWLNDPIHGASQQAFLRKVKDAGLTLQTFRNPDELARLVKRSLAEWHQRERNRQAALAQSHQTTVPQTTRVPFMAPDLPIGFVQRPKQFEALRALLLEEERKDPVAITTALTGAGGFGKTTLAAALCHDEEIIQAFDDGILWTTLGETPDLADALAKLHAGLTGERPAFKDAEDAATSLAERLEGKNCLVVIDDVWDPAHLEPFLRGGPGCARLITSRLLQVATDVQAQRLLVDEMSASEALAMLTARLPGPPPDPAPFQALARALGEWPLLLRLAASAMAALVELGSSVAEALASILDDLAEGGITSWDRDSPSDRNAAVAQTLQLSLKRLTAAEQEHYKKLAVFPEDEPIPLPVAAQLWGLDGSNSRRLAVKLATASLLEFNLAAGQIRLHDVLRTFLGQTLGQAGLAQAHAGLIEAWGDPHQLPHPYAWRWIGYHLEAAGRQSQLDGLLLDCPWLQAKLNATGIAALEREFDHGSAAAALQRLRRVLRNASHVLAAHPEQFPSQLLARWPTAPPGGPSDPAATRLRDQASTQLQKAGGLRPLTASLLADQALLRTLTGHGSTVNALAVLPDGRLASGADDGTIKLWDPASGQLQATLEGHSGPVNALAVLPNGRLASGAGDRTIKLWDPASGQLQATLEGHSGPVNALAVLPDGRLASGAGDRTIKLWDPASGQL
ncbi:MAG: NB-ARC domain-containing protein, partial [Cyanobacteria bacterium]|nr:NB-ARC domain-containing protein [Cyanobacteriota bacterium]